MLRYTAIPDLRASATATVEIAPDPSKPNVKVKVNVTVPNMLWVETKSPKDVNELKLSKNDFQIARTLLAFNGEDRKQIKGSTWTQAVPPKGRPATTGTVTDANSFLNTRFIPGTQLYVTVAKKNPPTATEIKFAAQNKVLLWQAEMLYQYVDPDDKTKGVFFKVGTAKNVSATANLAANGEIAGGTTADSYSDAVKRWSGLDALPATPFAPFKNAGDPVFRK